MNRHLHNKHTRQYVHRASLTLAGFCVVATVLVVGHATLTDTQVKAAQQRLLQQSFDELLHQHAFDNDPTTDRFRVIDNAATGSDSRSVYRVRHRGEPVAAIIEARSTQGYSGNIELLVAVDTSNRLMGVRVTSHRETPGLGDGIDIQRSPWITTFDRRSLQDMASASWTVRKDGGEFDQLTGATITSRAVVHAVLTALEWYSDNRDAVFAYPTSNTAVDQHKLRGVRQP